MASIRSAGSKAAAKSPYPLAADLHFRRAWLSDAAGAVSGLEKNYDFATGELTSRFHVRLARRGATIEVITFCWRADRPLLTRVSHL